MNIKKLLAGLMRRSPNETKEEARARQNVWLKSQLREWQLAWHELFDKDPGQATADNAAKDEQIPDDLNCDFRLIFGFCEVTADTRAACFDLLPQGEKLAERFEQFFSSRNAPITDEDAMKLAIQLRENINRSDVNFQGDWSNIVIADAFNKDEIDDLGLEYRVHDLFDGSLLDPHPEDNLREVAASLFLTEPFYAAAGNSYQPGQWIKGIYLTPAQDACLRLVYELWLGKWDVEVGSKGVALVPVRNL